MLNLLLDVLIVIKSRKRGGHLADSEVILHPWLIPCLMGPKQFLLVYIQQLSNKIRVQWR